MRKQACERCSTALHRYVEGELRRFEANAVREHLVRCAHCRSEEAILRAEQLWLLENLLDSPPLSERLTGKIVRRIESARQRGRLRRGSAERSVRWEVVAAAGLTLVALLVVRSVPDPRGGTLATASFADDATRREREPPEAALPAAAESLAPRAEAGRSPRARGAAPGLVHSDSDTRGESRRLPRSGARTPVNLNLAHVVHMAHSFAQSERNSAPNKMPCDPDPNRDGKTDLNDIAFSCQVLLGRQSMLDALAVSTVDRESGSLSERDCEDDCLRV